MNLSVLASGLGTVVASAAATGAMASSAVLTLCTDQPDLASDEPTIATHDLPGDGAAHIIPSPGSPAQGATADSGPCCNAPGAGARPVIVDKDGTQAGFRDFLLEDRTAGRYLES
jgi:hypothetical protein